MRPTLSAAGLALALVLLTTNLDARGVGATSTPTCAPATGAPPPAPAPTGAATVREAFSCLLSNYAAAPHVDDQQLLLGAFGGIVGFLRQRQLDRSFAALPALSGDAGADWRAFAEVYAQIAASLPGDSAVRQGLAVAAIQGMVDSLRDDHTDYTPVAADQAPPPQLGMFVRFPGGTPVTAVVDQLNPAGPAQRAGLRPGDVVTAVDGRPVQAPPTRRGASMSPAFDPAAFEWGDFTQLGWLTGAATSVELTVFRPSTASTSSVTLQAVTQLPPANLTARVLDGDVAYVRFHSFSATEGQDVLAAIAGLGLGDSLRGVVLDIRGNTGGSPQGMVQLVSAFVHGKTLSTVVTGSGVSQVLRTDDTVPLLQRPVVLLVDGASLSAADQTSAAFRDLHVGRLVGERTAGVVAGPARPFALDDGSILAITTGFNRGPNGEIVDKVGVPVDDPTPLPSAADLSAGRDPAVDQGLRDLGTGARAR